MCATTEIVHMRRKHHTPPARHLRGVKFIVVFSAALTFLTLFDFGSEMDEETSHRFLKENAKRRRSRKQTKKKMTSKSAVNMEIESSETSLAVVPIFKAIGAGDSVLASIHDQTPPGATLRPPEVFAVCGRTATFDLASWSRQQQYYNASNCPPFDPNKKMLDLRGSAVYGRTANQLRSFLRAVQFARDKRIQLGIRDNSWAMKVIFEFFMADDHKKGERNGGWKTRIEESLCVKILPREKRTKKRVTKFPKKLFYYESNAPREEMVASQLHIIRTLFQHHNTGVGHNGKAVQDMCSGINSLFTNVTNEEEAGAEDKEGHRNWALYSVIHLRSLEGEGERILAEWAERTGCDRLAALEMRPEYIKSILAPPDMLAHPIVVISDNQRESKKVLRRLQSDPDIGPMIRVVPKEARWFGGDMTLAVMANVFIGNPASTMSGFIAASRVALGFGHSYIYLAKDENGEWTKVRGGKQYTYEHMELPPIGN